MRSGILATAPQAAESKRGAISGFKGGRFYWWEGRIPGVVEAIACERETQQTGEEEKIESQPLKSLKRSNPYNRRTREEMQKETRVQLDCFRGFSGGAKRRGHAHMAGTPS